MVYPRNYKKEKRADGKTYYLADCQICGTKGLPAENMLEKDGLLRCYSCRDKKP